MLKIIREYKKGINLEISDLIIYRNLEWTIHECKNYLIVVSKVSTVRISSCKLLGCIAYGKALKYSHFCFNKCILNNYNFIIACELDQLSLFEYLCLERMRQS